MPLSERPPGFTVASALSHRATVHPERPFLLFDGRSLSYGEVESQAEALAASLHGLGIEAGDRVAILLPAWPEFVVSVFALAKLGAVAVPLNPRLTTLDLQYMLRHSEAVAAVTVETLDETDFLQVFEELIPQLPELQYLVTVGDEDLWYDDRIFQFEDLISAGAGRHYPGGALDPQEDVFAIVYTSGTTGKPKGVELTHGNLVEIAAGTAEAVGLGPDDRVSGMTELFHVFALGPGILGTALTGASLVLQDQFDPAASLDLVEAEGVTVQFGIPTLFARELQEWAKRERDLSTLRLGLAAGAPVREELVSAVEERLMPRLLVAYSLTETSSTLTMTSEADPGEQRRHTVGRPLPGISIRVLALEGGELPVESVGELAVKGPGVMQGYYRQPRETSTSFDDQGYLLTGDLGMVDDQGYVHLVGRRKEVIIRSGFNVYPRELEDRIHGHPAVDEAVVVGVPDEILGEAICACIVPIEGAIVTGQEVKEWCRAALADHKVPDLVQFFDEFPHTGTGKIRRVELARSLRAEEEAPR